MASPFDSPLLLASAEPEFVPQYSKLFGRGTPTTSGQASWISNTTTLSRSTSPIDVIVPFHTFTLSCWLKRSLLNPNAGVTIPEVFFQIKEGANGVNTFNDTGRGFMLGFQKSAENTWFQARFVNGTTESLLYETRIGGVAKSLLDSSSWFHLVFNFRSFINLSGSEANFYINGIQWPVNEATSNSVANAYLNEGRGTITYGAGRMLNAAATPVRTNSPFHGYISEAYFIATQTLGPEFFGQLDTKRGSPRWVPKRYTGIFNRGVSFGGGNFATQTADHYLQFDNVEGSTAWKDSGPNNNHFSQVFIDTAWTTTNSARNWTGIDMSADGRYQTATAYNGQIYRSTDFGATFVAVPNPAGVPSPAPWEDVSVSSNGQIQLAVAGNGNGVYISTDFGQNWGTPAGGGGTAIAMSEDRYATVTNNVNSSVIVNGSSTLSPADFYYDVAMSKDGKYITAVGQNRFVVNSNYGAGPWLSFSGTTGFRCVAMSADGRYQIAGIGAGTASVLYRSVDYGLSWSPVGEFAGFWTGVAMSYDGMHVVAIGQSGPDRIIIRSSNYGVNWTPATAAGTALWYRVAMSSTGQYQTATAGGFLDATGFIYRSINVVQNLTNDQTVDVPYTIVSNVIDSGIGKTVRGNYCTLQGSAQSYNGAALQPWFNQGNLQVSPVNAAGIGYQGGTSYLTSPGTIPITSGKWYFEATVKAYTDPATSNRDRFRLGILSSKSSDSQSIIENTTTASAVGNSATSYAIRGNSASGTTLLQKITNSVATTFTWPSKTALAANDVLMCAVDMDTKNVRFGVNGFWGSEIAVVSPTWTVSNLANTVIGGNAWQDIDISANGKYQTAVRLSNTQTAIAVSSNYGITWTTKNINGNFVSVSISKDGRYQLLGSNGGTLFLSTDYGETFNAVTTPGTANWAGVAVSRDGRLQTAVVNGGRIWRSDNWGQTWNFVGDGVNRGYIAVAMSEDGVYQLAAAQAGQLYRSANSGQTWAAISITNYNSAFWSGVAVSSDGTYQTATVNGPSGRILRSTNLGVTWATTGDATLRPYNDVAMDATGRYQLVVVGTTDGTTFFNSRISSDFGATFTAVDVVAGNVGAAVSSLGNWFLIAGGDVRFHRIGTDANLITDWENENISTFHQLVASHFSIANLTEALPAVSFYRGSETTITNLLEVNFGQRPYTYQAPSGYKSLCTSNLPEPLYPLASNFFDGKDRLGSGAMTQLSALSGIPSDIVISSDNKTAYIPGSAAQAGFLNVVNLSSSTIQLNINQEIISNAPIVPRGAVITPDDRYVYIADSGNNQIIRYNTTWDTGIVTLSGNYFRVAISSDGQYQTAIRQNGQIYINSNYGQGLWTTVESNRAWYDIAMSSDGRYQLAGVVSGQVYLNANYGQDNWNLLSVGNLLGFSYAVADGNGQLQTLVQYGGKIYTNGNYGQGAWTPVAAATNYDFCGIALSQTGQYQTTIADGGGIYRSINGGSSWDEVNNFVARDYTDIAINSTGKLQVAVVDGGQIFVSDNYGTGAWTATESNRNWSSVAISDTGQYITATAYGGKIYTNSLSGTGVWTERADNRNWNSVAMSYSGQYQTAVATTGDRIYVSSDYGATWTPVGESKNWFKVAMNSSGQYQVAVGIDTQIYENNNYGLGTWTALDSKRQWTSIDMDSSGLNRFAMTYNGPRYAGVVGQSVWNVYGGNSSSLIATAVNSTGQYQSIAIQNNQIFINNNYGQGDWTAVDSNRRWRNITMSSSGQYQIACTDISDPASGVYVSNNYGVSWSRTFVGIAGGPVKVAISSTGQYQVVAINSDRIYTNNNFGISGYWMAGGPTANWMGIAMSSTGQYLIAVAQAGTVGTNLRYFNSNFGNGNWIAVQDTDKLWTDAAISSDGKIRAAIASPAANFSGGIYTHYDSIAFTSLSSNQFSSLRNIDITPDGRYLYVTSLFNDKLIEIDLQTNAEIVYNTGNGPLDVKVAPNGKYLVVTNRNTFTATFLDLQTKDQIEIDLTNLGDPSVGTLGSGPSYIAITSDSKKVYITTTGSPGGGLGFGGIVEVTIPEVPEPFDPLTASNFWSLNNLRYLIGDSSSRFLASTLDINIQSDDASLYVSNSNGGLALYDLTTNTVTSAFPTSIHAFKCSNDDKFVLRSSRQTPSILFREDVRDVQSLNFTPQLVWTKQNSGSVLADHHFAYSQPELTSPTNSRVTVAATNTVAVSSNANNGAIFNYYTKNSTEEWIPVLTGSLSWDNIAMSFDGKFQTIAVDGGRIYNNSDYGRGQWTTVEASRNWRGIAMSSDGKYRTAIYSQGNIIGQYIVTNSNYGLNSTWTTVGPATTGYSDVAMSSDGKYQTVVGNDIQILKSEDYGETWTTTASAFRWSCIAMSSDGQYQVAGGVGTDLYVSNSYGDPGSWVQTNSGRRAWVSVAMSSNGQYIVGVSYQHNTGTELFQPVILRNTNYGIGIWTVPGFVEPGDWRDVAMSSDGKNLIAAANSVLTGLPGGLFRSSDFGGNWFRITASGATASWQAVGISKDGVYRTAGSFLNRVSVNGPYFENNRNNKYSLRYTSSAPLSGRTTVKNNSYNDYVWGSDPNILSITEYTGDGGANRTIPHTLGNIPDWVLIKRKTSASGWVQFVKTMAANSYFTWSNAAAVVNSAVFTTGSWTGSDVIVGTDPLVNASGVPYVMFAFKEIPGISSIGSYRTPYSTTWGTLVNTGFAPELVLIKAAAAGNDWILFDNFSINSVNTVTNFLLPNSNVNSATAAGTQIDILSNGFKVRGTNARISSTTNTTFYYIAFAKSPFKYANGGKPFSSIL